MTKLEKDVKRKKARHQSDGLIWRLGATDRIRTYDPLITNEMLYQLSYSSIEQENYTISPGIVQGAALQQPRHTSYVIGHTPMEASSAGDKRKNPY